MSAGTETDTLRADQVDEAGPSPTVAEGWHLLLEDVEPD